MAPFGSAINETRRRALSRLAKEELDSPLPEKLKQRIHDPILRTALQTMASLLFSIVFLMTTKPSLPDSLIVMAVALALSLTSGLFIFRPARSVVQRVDTSTDRTREPVG